MDGENNGKNPIKKPMIRQEKPTIFGNTPNGNIFDISDHLYVFNFCKMWTEVLIIQQGNHHFGFPHLTTGRL